MQPSLRVLPLALGILCAVRGVEAGDTRPVIFAPAAAQTAIDPPKILPPRSPISERLRGMITEQVAAMENARAFDVSSLPIKRSVGAPVVMMEEYQVKAAKIRPVELPVAEPSMIRLLKTGRLFESLDGKVQFTADLNLVVRPPVGALPKEPVLGVELSFRFKW